MTTRLRRLVLGDPPVNSAGDAFARFGFLGAWLLGAIGIVGGADLLALLAPAGVLLVCVGVVFARNVGGAFDQALERQSRRWDGRALLFGGRNGRVFGGAVILIGLIWTAMGIAQLAS